VSQPPVRADRLRPGGLLLEVYVNKAELALLLEMMRAGGHSTLASVTRTALFRYAQHLEQDPPLDAFRLDRKDRN